MKRIRSIIAISLILTYFTFYSCQENIEEHNHDHSNETTDHDHGEETEHIYTDNHIHEDSQEEQLEHAIPEETNWEELVGLSTSFARKAPIELLLKVPGRIVPNENEIAEVSTFIESSINRIFVNIGDIVKKGDLLACLICPEIGVLRADYDKAKTELEILRQDFIRHSKLYKENIISLKSYQEAELKKNIAEVNSKYTRKKLLALGIPEDEIENASTEHGEAVGATIHIYAPISGVICFRNARKGEKKDKNDKLFEIINLNKLWLYADIFEKDLTKIQIGQKVNITTSAYENDFFEGEIFYISNILEEDTKTIKILVEIDNNDKKLKPGMFVNGSIITGYKENALIIPKQAVLEDNNLKIVFVKEGENYHRHVVSTGIESVEYVEILSGLHIGNEVVTTGNYQLKSKQMMMGVDPHAGHSH